MWVIIEEKRIRHLWECPECNNHVYVKPSDYEDIGIPICTECEWDDVMNYIHTEIDQM